MMKAKLKSMTGYGVARESTPLSYLEANIRSVNGRFLEMRVHLPREFGGLEAEVRKILGQFFHRGSVDVFITRKARGDNSHLKLFFHEEMAKAWLQAANRLEKLASFERSLDLNVLLQLPQVVGFEEDARSLEQEAQEILTLIQKACQSCLEEREREGEALRGELTQILDRLNHTIGQMNDLTQQTNNQLKEKMETRLKARWTEVNFDPHRLQQEWALLWDKADITEEMGRLKEHLQHYRTLLHSTQAQGKKLDFYTQELLREVNTIGSKSPSAQLTHLVVLAKTEIEKLREQVQNIE